MRRRKTKSKGPISPRAVATLAVLALVLFAAGETYLSLRTDRGRLLAARWLPWGDDARVTRLVGKSLRAGIEAAGVPRDSVHETFPDGGRAADAAGAAAGGRAARLLWRVGLAPDNSLLQANYTITRSLEKSGIDVLAGRERTGKDGDVQVVLDIGFGGIPTHQVVLSRMPRVGTAAPGTDAGRIALVVFGFGDDEALARAFLALPAPFAVALPPDGNGKNALFRAAHEHGREVVLHVPLEPINYPQMNPGPGTILVTMKPAQIGATMRRYIELAGPITAVANHMGSLATQDMTVMAAVYRELRRQRLPFLHVSPVAGAVCKSLASELGVAYEEPDEVIDYEVLAKNPALLEKRWQHALEMARSRNHIVVLIRASDRTRTFLPRALDPKRLKGVSVVPLASLLKRPAV